MRKQLQSSLKKKSALSSKDASYILEKISCNTERVFNKTKDQQQRKFDKLGETFLCFDDQCTLY